MSTSSQIQEQHQRQQRTTTPKKLGLFQSLLKPGWDSAEIIIPFLHKCLAALLAVLLYTAQHNEGHVRVHLLVMSTLTLGLWGSVTWYVQIWKRVSRSTRWERNPLAGGEKVCMGGTQDEGAERGVHTLRECNYLQ